MARMERIHVAIRARPLSADDAKTSPWRISGNSISNPKSSSKFEFDRIFGEDCKTSDVYQSRTKDLVAAAIDGFNGTVFAYGQTNSGKTYTIRGSATEPGVIRLAVRDLFNLIQQDVNREFLLRMSYMEIYNEEINDLLAPEHRKLQIHESIERGIYVAGLREEIVASPEQVLNLMEFGESHRHIGETNMNLYSSRSHTIFRMIIESRDKTEDEDIGSSGDAVRVSVLNLVDLAGSERAAKTGAEGVRLKEGSHINKSLMTLGTVIKKLSEGAESQGGHVPYRDSKLTRILQPALGGNANTAIICNITLAQIHADETKSSLQFASRALRVTNCAHVNEILTDAALLKRQKKEIEELRAKLQDSHSEHWTEEILNLRNTLLQTELERERIALELEEEKKAQAEREKMVQQQAKQIENLSSMVLYSNRDENRDRFKKQKRRDTWCPGNLAKQALGEVPATIISKASAINPMRPERDVRLLPFDELVNETDVALNESCKDEELKKSAVEDCTLPDPCALLHVTSRRKVPPRNKSLCQDNELFDLQGEYEDLLVEFETQRTCSEIQIDFLTRKLAEADMFSVDVRNDYSTSCVKKGAINVDKNVSLRQSEAILVIKRLQEQIKRLEMEMSSGQQNLDSVVELAKEQNICAVEKFGELREELLIAREESRVAREQHTCHTSVTQVIAALREAGLESSNLILGIDFTKSNEWTGKYSFNRKSLHAIGSTPNPYEQAISIIGRTMSPFDEDNIIPCFGFGDASTHDVGVFSFYPDDRCCVGFEEALARYREIVPYLRLSGPTSFAPIIDAAIDIVEESNGQYHVLVIIADGQVTRSPDTPPRRFSTQEQATVNSIVAASKYPLSIILVGVGDGPWDAMQQFDDNIPQRAFDNFQFVNFTKIMSDNRDLSQKEAAFALAALMEIPSQYRATQRLHFSSYESEGGPRTRPLPPPRDVINHDNAVKSIPPMTSFLKVEPSAPGLPVAPVESMCPICLTNPKDMAFQCGHTTCKDCGVSLSSCPLCRQPISTRLRLYT